MDSLKSLMDKREYELIIKLTDNSEEMNDLFYRISAFLAIGKGLDALDVIKTKRSVLEGNLAILMKIHIEILCLLGLFDEAYKELEYYQGKPYVSQETEEILNKLPEYIRLEEKKTYSFKKMDDEQIKNLLHSDEINDVIGALDVIREKDLSIFMNDIKWLLTRYQSQSVRTLTLLLLIDKKYDAVVNFNHLGKIISLNPSTLKPPFIGEEFNLFVKKIQTSYKNTSLGETAVQLVSTHILYIYPNEIPYYDENFFEALYEVSCEYLKVDHPSLSDRLKEKKLDTDEVQKWISLLNESLENF